MTMNMFDLLEELRGLGATLELERSSGKLLCRAPRERLALELLSLLKANRQELRRLLIWDYRCKQLRARIDALRAAADANEQCGAAETAARQLREADALEDGPWLEAVGRLVDLLETEVREPALEGSAR